MCSPHILYHLVHFFSFSHGLFSPCLSPFKSYAAVFTLFACLSPPLLNFLLISLFQSSFNNILMPNPQYFADLFYLLLFSADVFFHCRLPHF